MKDSEKIKFVCLRCKSRKDLIVKGINFSKKNMFWTVGKIDQYFGVCQKCVREMYNERDKLFKMLGIARKKLEKLEVIKGGKIALLKALKRSVYKMNREKKERENELLRSIDNKIKMKFIL